MSSGMYKYASDLEEFTREEVLDYAVNPFELRFYAEGLSSVVTVGIDTSDGNVWLANNGKVDASSLEDRSTQILLAHLPFLFRPRAERVLIIGLASGLTAGSVTLHTAPKQIDIAELEPAIVTASHEFDHVNHRPLEDPRVRVHLNDARNHLLLSEDGAYDLVTSEPSNPWLSGVSNLFTREFFALGKRKLSSRGVWAQWLHGYGMTSDDLLSLLATFADVYANVRVFRLDSSDLVLIGSDGPLPLGTAAFEAVMRSNEAVRSDLALIEMHRGTDLLALYSIGAPTIRKLAAGIELNTDDNMRIEYSAPLHLHTSTSDANTAMLETVSEVPSGAVRGPEELAFLARAYETNDTSWRRALAAAREAASLRPEDPVLVKLYQTLRAQAGAEGPNP
jgi:spermidine synthase